MKNLIKVALIISVVMLLGCATNPVVEKSTNIFDAENAGIYAIIHREGYVTDSVFRVRKIVDQWVLEDKKDDGSWEDVTCEIDCISKVSSVEDVNRFLKGAPSAITGGQCFHNTAFAFCRFYNKGAEDKSFVMLAFVEGKIVPIFLKRLGDLNNP